MPASMRPRLPIPAPLRGSDPGSFAYNTISGRLPRIGRRVVEENAFAPEIEARLEALVEELPAGKVRALKDREAPDAADWDRYIAPHAGQNWLEVPWFFAETYFYRRILEATGYFEEGEQYLVDPYRPHKEQNLQSSWAQVQQLAGRLARWQGQMENPDVLREALSLALWGNQGDLSMWPGGAGEMPGHDDEDTAQAHVLVDDRDAAVAYLQGQREQRARIDMIMDNAGLELASDLALVDVLLGGGWADTVVLDVKFHPTFVSDVVPRDVRHTMRALLGGQDEAEAWGRRLVSYADKGRIFLRQHRFWTSPLAGWEMPADVRETLAEATLVIVKGDANYRRLLGDRHWDYAAPFADVAGYFPAPLLALRTFKSNVAAGLETEKVRELDAKDRSWVISGEWGVMQFGQEGEGRGQKEERSG